MICFWLSFFLVQEECPDKIRAAIVELRITPKPGLYHTENNNAIPVAEPGDKVINDVLLAD
jgi:hypothetical protein